MAAIVLGLVWRLWTRRTRLPDRAITVEMIGLCWHLVDVIWVFLYPVLYLARGTGRGLDHAAGPAGA